MSGDTVIVVPCYNESARLNVGAFAEYLARTRDVSLVLVDDGSRDGTRDVLERLRTLHPARVAILGLGENVGKAEAVRRGVKAALRRSPAFVGYWDADLATPLVSIDSFRNLLLDRPELQLVMGSRVGLLGRQIERSWKRHYLGRAFATAASIVLRLAVYDTQCGAKLFRVTPETATLFESRFLTRWIFDVEILARLLAVDRADSEWNAAQAIYEYPLERWQDVAGSRLRPRDFAVAAADLVRIHWRYRRSSVEYPLAKPISIPAEERPSVRRDAA